MALRNIVKRGDQILSRKCRDVSEINERILILLDDMIETMRKDGGVGIAAPQVGVARRICILEPNEHMLIEMINPEILSQEGEQISTEGCLSVPGMVGEVKRPTKVEVKYQNRNGEDIITEFEGYDAIVFSHELDHLEGILYVDKATNLRELGNETDEESELK